jgi:hypothetical protein
MNEIHPLVLATIEHERARRELELERLRSAREACATSSAGGQSRALALGKKIRQVERITASWRLVLATVLDDDPRGEACPHDCDHCHGADCPCPRMGCAGDPDREDGADRTVAYRGTTEPVLHCVRCVNHAWQEWTALTSEDLPDGGVCGYCHGDVLRPPVVDFPDGSTMRGETDAEFQKRMGLDL